MRRILSTIILLLAACGALADINITNIPVATGGAATGDKLLGVTNSTHAALVEIKFLNQLAGAYLLGSSNAYLGSFTGNGAGLTNLPGGLATNVPVLVAGTNIWIDVNGLTNTISTLNGLATTNYVGTYYYLQSNPSNFVTATVTNGLATTNWVGQNFWQTNQSVPFDIYTNSSGALSNPLSATALAFQQGYGISRTWTVSNNIAITTASIDTNTVITTNGGTFIGQILDNSVSSDAPAANQLVKASWVRSLFSGGTFLYNITNAHPVDATWFIASDTTNSSAQVRTYTGVTNNQYLGTGIMSTQAFTTVYSPMTVNAYLSFNTGGARAVSVKPEFYYVYTNLATNAIVNLLGDYDCGPQAIAAGTNLYTFVVSFPTVSSTNPFYVVRRFKVTSQNANPDVSIHGSGSTPSHISFNTPPATQVASSVYASNVISGGVLPAGTVSSTSLTPGYALGNDGSVRIWTNMLNSVSIGGNAATATAAAGTPWITGNQTITLSGDATGSGTTAITVSVTNIASSRLNTPTNNPTDGYVLTAKGTGGATAWAAATSGSFTDYGQFGPNVSSNNVSSGKRWWVWIPGSGNTVPMGIPIPAVLNGTGLRFSGTTTVPTHYMVYTAATTNSDAQYGHNPAPTLDPGTNCYYYAKVALTNISNIRSAFGYNPSRTTDSWAAFNAIAFRFSTAASDTTWKCISSDLANAEVSDSGVTVVADSIYTLSFQRTGNTIVFYINGTSCATNTTYYPVAGNGDVGPVTNVRTLDAVVKAVRVFGATGWGMDF